MQQSRSNSLLDAFDESSSTSQRNRMLLEAFEALPDLVFLFSAEGRLIHTNAAASRVHSGELARGKRCCEMFWHVEGADGCVVDRAMQTAEKVEVEILAGTEGESSISIIVEPLKSDDRGVGPGALVIARDISDLRRAEAEAIAHKSFIASIADRTPDEIYALDPEGCITWMNERAEAFKVSMSLGGSFLDIVSEDSRTVAAENLSRTVAGNDTEYEVRLVRPNGSIRYAEAHTSPLWKDG